MLLPGKYIGTIIDESTDQQFLKNSFFVIFLKPKLFNVLLNSLNQASRLSNKTPSMSNISPFIILAQQNFLIFSIQPLQIFQGGTASQKHYPFQQLKQIHCRNLLLPIQYFCPQDLHNSCAQNKKRICL